MSEEKKSQTEDSEILLAGWYDRSSNAKGEDYTFTRAGNLYRLMNDESKRNLINNIVDSLRGNQTSNTETNVDLLQLCYWFRADMNLGMAVAYGLNLDMKEMMKQMPLG
jgi:catalase